MPLSVRRGLCLFLVLALASIARGADPQIVGPDKDTIAAYKIVRYEITGLGETDGVLWRVRPVDPKNVVDFGLGGKRNTPKLEFVAPPGTYNVECVIVKAPMKSGERFVIDEFAKSLTIGDAPTPPNPPGPNPPNPPAPDVDSVLVGKLKTALEMDMKDAFPAGGSKENAVKLAEVYLFAAEKLAANEAPDTVGKLFEVVATVSATDKKIPRLPYLGAVRAVAGDTFGPKSSADTLDSAKRADFALKFRKLGLALKEAAK